MYFMKYTRSGIAYAIIKFSRYTSNPNDEHWMVVIWLFKYLMRTSDFGFHYKRYPALLEGYYDPNWLSDSEEHKSTGGYVFTCGNAIVLWKSNK